jgi:hypothetical protein
MSLPNSYSSILWHDYDWKTFKILVIENMPLLVHHTKSWLCHLWEQVIFYFKNGFKIMEDVAILNIDVPS